jgi:hypothetical protein
VTVYYLQAGDHVLQAWSAAELAELLECALAAGDPIAWLRADGGRLLTDDEFAAVLANLAS